MFPNVRLLIVAVFASIVALSCGFGVFAAFRVNHDPLSRLPPVTAPLQLVADNAAPTTVTIAPGTPFGSRFRFGEAQIGNAAADAPAQHASETQAAPVAAASPPAPVGAEETPAPDAGQDAKPGATADSAPAQAPAQEMQAAQAAHDAEQGETTDNASQPASAAIPDVATIEPAANQAQPVEQPAEETDTAPESATTSEVKASAEAVKTPAKSRRKTARRVVKQQRVAAKTHPVRRTGAPAVAHLNDQNSMSPHFESAPDAFQGQPVRSRRAARKTAKRIAVGGPFVRPKGQ